VSLPACSGFFIVADEAWHSFVICKLDVVGAKLESAVHPE